MASVNGVWGIEIGQCALKAIKLRPADDGKVEIVAFDLIEHPKILSQPDADAEELIKSSLEKFASRNEWQGDQFVIGVPGQQTFSRFCKLPPVDEKKIPDIVRFEASQQIPFDMDDVVWDYEVFREKDSPEVEVGIFAMRKDLVRKHIDYYSGHGINTSVIQTVPSALYNFCRFDQELSPDENDAVVVIDVGAQKTDLVIVEPNSAWTRNIPLGGNNFTEALIKSFKLSFSKAENLKRTAASHKYARNIFQSMRPVFAELVAEIQRSLGFYSSTHRDVHLKQVLACGNAFRLPGLQKYLENNLSIEGGVIKLEKFAKVVPTATSNAPQFTENILSFAAAYGLALQGLGLAKISSNLLPPELARIAMWKQKQPYFMATAAALVLAAILPWTRSGLDAAALASNSDAGDQAARLVQEAQRLAREFQQAQSDSGGKEANIQQLFELQKNKALVPTLFTLIHAAAPTVPEIAQAESPEAVRKLIEANKAQLERTSRRQVMIEAVQIKYSGNIDAEERPMAIAAGGSSMMSGAAGPYGAVEGEGGRRRFAGGGGEVFTASSDDSSGESKPGFVVTISGRLTYGKAVSDAVSLITEEFYSNLVRLGRQPGLGFFIPEEDPKALDKRNLGHPNVVQYYEGVQPAGGTFAGGAVPGMVSPEVGGYIGKGGGRSGDIIGGEYGGLMGMVPGMPQREEIDPFKDPVTGEDMKTDWRFTFSFKVQLGEMPEQPAEQDKNQ